MLAAPGGRVNPAALAAMTEMVAHRGPDDEGYHFFDLAAGTSISEQTAVGGSDGTTGGLGFRRLSIQDLSPAGHQPMTSCDGTLLLVFNGEIYNAPQLRDELKAEGVSFRGHSDTEVLLRLFEREGEQFLRRLNGMFALAVVDLRRGRLLLARDRSGIKPLYYMRVGDRILFGSEIKSFLAHPGVRPELDRDRLEEYVQFRYCAGAGTLLKGVVQLPPAHLMSLEPDLRTTVRSYWSLPEGIEHHSESDGAIEELEQQLEASVRRQLLADVEVGCQLSGGIDSSLVNLYASRNVTSPMHAFSVTLADPRFSEEPWIREAASKASVTAHAYRMGATDFAAALERAAWHLDQPLNHPNSLGLFFLAEHASKRVKVLLSGEGADELMGGYPRFFYASTRSALGGVLPLLHSLGAGNTRAGRRLGIDTHDEAVFWVEASRRIGRSRAEALLGRPLDGGATAERVQLFARTPGVDFLTRCMNYEMSTYLVDLLIRQDKMTMSHSIENRVPFLDHELIEMVRRTFSSKMLVKGLLSGGRSAERRTKRPLKELSRKWFGDAFTFRPKSGFAIPLRSFFAHPSMVERIEDTLLPGIEGRGVFSAVPIRGTWRNMAAAPDEAMDALWCMLSFELWAQSYLDRA